MDTPAKVNYLLHVMNWNEKVLGYKVGNAEQWLVSRWKRGKQNPSGEQILRIDQLCYETILTIFHSPNGFRYICNLGPKYGQHFRARAEDALERLKAVLVRECPLPPVGRLNIVVFTADLPPGARAQCFCSTETEPRSYIILVRDEATWLTSVRDEVFAHILPTGTSSIEVRES